MRFRAPPTARLATPSSAKLLASVAPEVNTISSASPPIIAATFVAASSTALAARHPSACSDECGFPKLSPKYGRIASKTLESSGVVA